jgi:hypothetical protein
MRVRVFQVRVGSLPREGQLVLSTFMSSEQLTTRMSAGILSPAFNIQFNTRQDMTFIKRRNTIKRQHDQKTTQHNHTTHTTTTQPHNTHNHHTTTQSQHTHNTHNTHNRNTHTNTTHAQHTQHNTTVTHIQHAQHTQPQHTQHKQTHTTHTQTQHTHTHKTFKFTTSPTTRSFASTVLGLPSRMTATFSGIMP